ncbi:2-amino-4-hydroxy-6-hydroxymethyldihydropteridine diphosphokinase [bacterium]|nr:2-amino-4-hydroxy-6-hydroxymethyldihydropteridine diphosphokinase [bacterium]
MKYLLSLGSNIGDSFDNLKKAISKLEEKSIFVDDCSSVYASSPVDYLTQSDFLNISLIVETAYEPAQLLEKLKSIEHEMGRVKTIEKGPRNIDLDIIFWENGDFESENLKIPHKEAANRLFVIFPTLEIIDRAGHFRKEKAFFHRLLETEQERFVGQKIEKLYPFKIDEENYGWKNIV